MTIQNYLKHTEAAEAARVKAHAAKSASVRDSYMRAAWVYFDAALKALAETLGGAPRSTAQGVPAFLAGVQRRAEMPKTSSRADNASALCARGALDHLSFIVQRAPSRALRALVSFPYGPAHGGELGPSVVGIPLTVSAYGYGTRAWVWVRRCDEARARSVLRELALGDQAAA